MIHSHLDRSKWAIPKESEFSPCLDGEYAWKNIGGCVINEAFSIFCENPSYYSGDYIHMGEIGFAYYFPVIDKFAREGALGEPFDEQDMSTVLLILDCNTRISKLHKKITVEVINLIQYLQEIVPHVATCNKEKRRFTNKLQLIANAIPKQSSANRIGEGF